MAADKDWWKRVLAGAGTGAAAGTALSPGYGTIGGAVIGGVGALFLGGGDDEDEFQWSMPPDPEWFQQPEYPEATGARGEWWSRLQDWGKEPGYGAIPQEWDKIWDLAKKRVSEYYRGTPSAPGGMVGRMKAGAARRGVSESPALETLIGRAGAEESGKLSDIATNQAIQRAMFGERGRQNWLTSLSNLSKQKPAGIWKMATGYQPSQDTTFGDLSGAIGSYLGSQGGQDWGDILDLLKDKDTGDYFDYGGEYGGEWGDIYSNWMESPQFMQKSIT